VKLLYLYLCAFVMCKGPAATVDEGLLPSGVSLNVRSLLVSLHFQVNTVQLYRKTALGLCTNPKEYPTTT
jgi:hypothetical protein